MDSHREAIFSEDDPLGADASFEWEGPRTRVVMAQGAIGDMKRQVEALGLRRLMLVSGGRTLHGPVGAAVRKALGELVVHVFDEVVEHGDSAAVARGAEAARAQEIDALVAVGGGSASDTAKAIAIVLAEGGQIEDHASTFVPPDQFTPKPLPHPKLPLISVPTTASAAEVTPGLGIRDGKGIKRLFWDVKLASRLIILDPQLNIHVPADLMAMTGMNALAHCVEGLYSRLRNPISDGQALQGIRILSRALPAMVAEPDDPYWRGQVLVGAHISGQVISNARVGIHHAVCHCLGSRGQLSHGVANSIMLPHAVSYNLEVARSEIVLMAEALGVPAETGSEAQAAIDALRAVQQGARVPTRLRDTGLDRALLPSIAADTMSDRGLYFNPRRTESADQVLALLEAAW